MSPHKPNWKGVWTSLAAGGLVIIAYSDVIIEAAQKAAKDAEKGITVGTIGAVVYAVNRSRRRKAFEKRDARWEAKLDAILQAVGQPNGLPNMEATSLKQSYNSLQPADCREGVSKVKAYLKKLTKTKFQAYILTTVLNVGTLIGMWTGNVQIEGQLKEWLPGITILVQLLATAVYQWVEGGIDKANLQKPEGTNNADTESSYTVSSEK